MKQTDKKKEIKILAVLLGVFLTIGVFFGCAKNEETDPLLTQEEAQTLEQKVVLKSYGLNLQVQSRHRIIVTETLTVEYPIQIDSICRVIPYEGYRYDPAKNEVIPYRMVLDQIEVDTDYSVRKEAGKAYLTIGTAPEGRSSGGTQIYTLKYRLSCYQDQDSQRDLFFTNLLPYGWENEISAANISITMPKDFAASNIKMYRYSGGSWMDSDISYTAPEKTISVYLKDTDITENPELSMQIWLEEGYFKGEKSLVPIQIFFYGLVLLLTLGILALWWFFGKPILREKAADVKKHKLTPLEDAYLLRNTISITDIAAFLSYWADNGVIRIIQLSANDYSITGLNSLDKGAKNFEFTIYNLLFGDGTKTISMNAAAILLRRNLGKIKRQVAKCCAALCAGRLYTLESVCTRIAALFFSVFPILIMLALGGHVVLDYSAGYVGLIAAAVLLVIHCGIAVLKQNWKNLPKLVNVILVAICIIAEITVLGGTVYYAASNLKYTTQILLAVVASLLMLAVALLSGRKSDGYQTQLSQLLAYKRYLKNPNLQETEGAAYYYRVLPQAYVLRVGKSFSKRCDSYLLPAHDGLVFRGDMTKLSHSAGFYPCYLHFINLFYRSSTEIPEKPAIQKKVTAAKESDASATVISNNTSETAEKTSIGKKVMEVLITVGTAILVGLQKLAHWINLGIDRIGEKLTFKRGKKEDLSDEKEEKED